MTNKTQSEHEVQNRIRNELAGECLLFRANVGRGWQGTGAPVRCSGAPMVVSMKAGDVLLRQARPFDTGLPEGFADTFGLAAVVITQDMVGQTFGRFIAGEVKAATGRIAPKQAAFLRAVNDNGGAADIWRSPSDAMATVARAKGKV